MNSLASLPQLTRAIAAKATRIPNTDPYVRFWRGEATRRMRRGIERGLVTPGRLSAALKLGDRGIACLLHENLPSLPPKPLFTQNSLPLGCKSRTMEAGARDCMLIFADRLSAAGYVSTAELQSSVRSLSPDVALRGHLLEGWDRMVTETIAKAGLKGAQGYRPVYQLSPGWIETKESMQRFEVNWEGDDDEKDAWPVICCDIEAIPVTRFPASPFIDPPFFRALRGAWDAIASRAFAFLAFFDPQMYEVAGWISEMFVDAALRAKWKGDEPSFSEEALEPLLMNEIEHTPELVEGLVTFARWMRLVERNKGWEPHSTEAFQWLDKTATRAQKSLIESLWALLPAMPKDWETLRKSVNVMSSSSQGFATYAFPTDYGLESWIDPCIEQLFGDGEIPSLGFTIRSEVKKPADLLVLIKSVIVSAATATAALQLVDQFHDDEKKKRT